MCGTGVDLACTLIMQAFGRICDGSCIENNPLLKNAKLAHMLPGQVLCHSSAFRAGSRHKLVLSCDEDFTCSFLLASARCKTVDALLCRSKAAAHMVQLLHSKRLRVLRPEFSL